MNRICALQKNVIWLIITITIIIINNNDNQIFFVLLYFKYNKSIRVRDFIFVKHCNIGDIKLNWIEKRKKTQFLPSWLRWWVAKRLSIVRAGSSPTCVGQFWLIIIIKKKEWFDTFILSITPCGTWTRNPHIRSVVRYPLRQRSFQSKNLYH